MTRTLYLVTGECPKTEADVRLGMAEIREAEGDHQSAAEWRGMVEQMRDTWADRSEVGRARRALSPAPPGPDPDALIEPMASPEHPMFWHEPRRDDSVVCPCGHVATLLCDVPIGRGRVCDMPLCQCCRVEVGPDFDRCAYHVANL